MNYQYINTAEVSQNLVNNPVTIEQFKCSKRILLNTTYTTIIQQELARRLVVRYLTEQLFRKYGCSPHKDIYSTFPSKIRYDLILPLNADTSQLRNSTDTLEMGITILKRNNPNNSTIYSLMMNYKWSYYKTVKHLRVCRVVNHNDEYYAISPSGRTRYRIVVMCDGYHLYRRTVGSIPKALAVLGLS